MTTQTNRPIFKSASIAHLSGDHGFGFSHRPRFHFEAEGAGSGQGAGDDEAAKAKAAQDEADAAAAAKKADEDKNKPTDREAELLKEVMAKKDANKALQDQIDALKANAAKFDGIDPDKVHALLKAEKDAEKAGLEAKGEFDRVKVLMAEEHAKEVDAIVAEKNEVQKLLNAAHAQIDNLTIGQQFANSEFLKDTVLTPNKARTIYGAHFERNAEGEIVAYDKPKDAKDRTPIVDATGKPVPFDVAMKKIVEADADRDRILKSSLAPGAGSGSEGEKSTDASKLRGIGLIRANLAKTAK